MTEPHTLCCSTFLSGTDAGAIPIPVQYQRAACEAIPALKSAFQARFVGCVTSTCLCGSDANVADIVKRPDQAFAVAAWWFVHGTALATPSVCGDLRTVVDVGGGKEEAVPSLLYPGSGFRLAVGCSAQFASGWQAGVTTKMATYQATRRLFDATWSTCSSLHAHLVHTNVAFVAAACAGVWLMCCSCL